MSTDEIAVLTPVTRPNGKTYQPIKPPIAVGAEDYDGNTEIYVLRTHDVEAAYALANVEARRLVGEEVDRDTAELWWLRQTIRNGERCYEHDSVRGVPAVAFGFGS